MEQNEKKGSEQKGAGLPPLCARRQTDGTGGGMDGCADAVVVSGM